jgi:periplasmic protein TonB
MNNSLAMDREDTIGLGTALGGHALLLALLVFGLWKAAGTVGSDGGGSGEGDGVAVELVSESSAPAALAPAPEPVVEEVVEPVEAEPEVIPEAVIAALPIPKAKPKDVPKPAAKPVTKSTPTTVTKRLPPKTATKTGTGRGTRSTDFEKQMEKTLGRLGGGGGATKTKGAGSGTSQGASTQTAGQIKSIASAAIASEVRPLIPGCAPSTSDNSSLRVFVQLNIGQSKNLISASVYDVQGITPSNQAQVGQMKKCVLDSLRAASPYNLDADGYETWRNHKVQLKVNFK